MDELAQKIADSKKYSAICMQTIERICEETKGRYKTQKEQEKAVKARLHQIAGMFVDESAIKKAGQILAQAKQLCDLRELLPLHVSTKERLSFMEAFFSDLLHSMDRPKRVLDIACGFNPFAALLQEGFAGCAYDAMDINLETIALIDNFYRRFEMNGSAIAGDVLYEIPKGKYDLVLLFKIMPLLEQQKKGYGAQLLQMLDARFFAVSFPTKSLSGRAVGMKETYSAYMEQTAEAAGLQILRRTEFENELLYTLKR